MATLERLNGVAEPNGGAPSRGRTIAVWAAVGVVLVGLLVSYWWWTHPTVLKVSNGIEGMTRSLPVAHAALSTTVIGPQVRGQVSTITIDKVTPVFAENSAKATATFSICHMTPGESPVGLAYDPARSCSDLVPLLPGATFNYGVVPDTDYLIMTLTPTQAGVVHVIGEDVTYSTGPDHLFRHGTQRMDLQEKLTAR